MHKLVVLKILITVLWTAAGITWMFYADNKFHMIETQAVIKELVCQYDKESVDNTLRLNFEIHGVNRSDWAYYRANRAHGCPHRVNETIRATVLLHEEQYLQISVDEHFSARNNFYAAVNAGCLLSLVVFALLWGCR
jgi:hypothetical protein